MKREAEELAERAKLLAHHDQHTTPEDGLTGYKWTFAFGATPFPAIMPIGPHPRDAGARANARPETAKGGGRCRRNLPGDRAALPHSAAFASESFAVSSQTISR
ncbi:hypothetical protein [Mesorhizobium sp. STM 4661]|uniref:hypothetical protein n=1 Tax=Mesorhizobium sp. STM 4661 TaxID=1297570 RepID=UPI001FCCB6B5|nr:hypothetical protein [Mesorhizobium sp. STM 4661]